MEILLWYKNLKRELISASLIDELKDCRFSISESGEESWNVVRIGRQKIFWGVSDRIESHICVTLYLPKAKPSAFPLFFQFFRRAVKSQMLPIREASLDVGPAFEFPFFSLEKFRNSMPPLLVREIKDEVWEESAPGEKDYWQKAQPKLHFVSSAVLTEPDVAEPEVWAERIGAIMHRNAQGVVFDCGWSDWCLKHSLDFVPQEVCLIRRSEEHETALGELSNQG